MILKRFIVTDEGDLTSMLIPTDPISLLTFYLSSFRMTLPSLTSTVIACELESWFTHEITRYF